MEKIRQAAFKKLNFKCCFTKELKDHLLQKGFEADQVACLIRELQRQGYLDDNENIKSLIRKAIRDCKGPGWILPRLRAQGLALDIGQLEALYPRKLRFEKIESFLSKNHKNSQKAIAALARRGFNLSEIVQIYKLKCKII